MLLEHLCQQVTYHYIHYILMIIDSIINILQMETTLHNVIGRWFCSKKFVLMVQSPVLVIRVKELPAQFSHQLFADLIHVTNHAVPSGC